MNIDDKSPDDSDHVRDGSLPDTLRDALRSMRTPASPSTDLWPDIAARLTRDAPDAVLETTAAPAHAHRQRTPSRRAWTFPVAMAASVAIAVAIGWQLQQSPAGSATDVAEPLIAHAATSMTREYRAAFAEVDARPLPATEARTIAQLDRTAADVRAALKQAPESRLLLAQLKRVYARRLDLSQRFARMG